MTHIDADTLYGISRLHSAIPETLAETESYEGAMNLVDTPVPTKEAEFDDLRMRCAEAMVEAGVAQLRGSITEQDLEKSSRLLRQGVLLTDASDNLSRLDSKTVRLQTDRFNRAITGLDFFIESLRFVATSKRKTEPSLWDQNHPLRQMRDKLVTQAIENYYRTKPQK